MSRRDRVSPLVLTTVLTQVRSEPWWPAFDHGLPVAGVDSHLVGGTLRHRMTGTRAAGNAHAKTGSLTGVTALSGYVTGRDGRRYAFSHPQQLRRRDTAPDGERGRGRPGRMARLSRAPAREPRRQTWPTDRLPG